METEVEVGALPKTKVRRKFYIFDGEGTLIDGNNQLINPQAIVPFVEMIELEESLQWALASSDERELPEDEAYKALRTGLGLGGNLIKNPVYVHFNRQATLLSSALAVHDLHVEWAAEPVNEKEKAKIVLDILLTAQFEAEDPQSIPAGGEVDLFAATLRDKPIKSQHSETTITFNTKTQITFQFGNTRIRFNLEKLLDNIVNIAKGDYKLFFILQALDAAKLKPTQTHLNFFGVEAIETPDDYTRIGAKDVVFLDDKESNCAVIANAGFTAIVADTAVTLDKRENKTTDTYLEKLNDTIPTPIFFRRFANFHQFVNLKTRSSTHIESARNNALGLILELVESNDLDALKDLPKLAPLFNYSEFRFTDTSINPAAVTEELLALADAYLAKNQYHKELSDFLVLNLGHEWKRADIQEKVKAIAAIKPAADADISTTHFREAYEAQYNSEFFKNPFSSMHKEIKRDPAAFDGKSMEEVKQGVTDKNGRSNIVLKALGAK